MRRYHHVDPNYNFDLEMYLLSMQTLKIKQIYAKQHIYKYL